jgi:hypothetical protein
MNVKRSLIIGATVATVSMAGVGVASAATSSTGTGGDTLAQKIATKFGLNASDVQTVIDQNRQDHSAQREANFKTNLATAVKNGKLTQAQADHITGVMSQIDTLQAGKAPSELDQSTRDQIQQLRKDLRQWAKDNKVNFKYVFAGNHNGRGMGHTPKSSDSSSSSTSN